MKAFGVLSPAGWRAVIRMAIALVAALIVGLILGRVWLVFTIVLAAALAFQLWNLLRVEHWLRLRSVESPPDIRGAWGELVAMFVLVFVFPLVLPFMFPLVFMLVLPLVLVLVLVFVLVFVLVLPRMSWHRSRQASNACLHASVFALAARRHS